ncbi:Zinc finger, C2H2 [Artemisia annua]|uniref:Zinc finger, C2H2 n=1 Tax=Artemisia annua TaxID=35608 RepID=A0A2U1MLH0_ARTAN|nr:Zinc finger, C2H2 [Artemisia annua]
MEYSKNSSMESSKNSIRNGLSAESHARKNLNEIVKKIEENPDVPDPRAVVYKCKECNKTFEKFQALGGHKASHKRTRSRDGSSTSPMFLHECKVCGEKFDIGQALGGHMRKHQGMKHEAGEMKNTGGDNVGHVLQQPKVEALQEEIKVEALTCRTKKKQKVEALQELKVESLQKQKAKSDQSEGVMSKDDNFKEETSTSDSGRQEFQFCDLRVPADEDEGASHTVNQIHTYYEFLKPADA